MSYTPREVSNHQNEDEGEVGENEDQRRRPVTEEDEHEDDGFEMKDRSIPTTKPEKTQTTSPNQNEKRKNKRSDNYEVNGIAPPRVVPMDCYNYNNKNQLSYQIVVDRSSIL